MQEQHEEQHQHAYKKTRISTNTEVIQYNEKDYTRNNEAIRTSSLTEPTIHLTGHKGSVYSLAFDRRGEILCSGSFDMTCMLWNVSSGNCENFNMLYPNHKNAVLDVKWSHDSEFIATASADKTIGWYDSYTCQRIKRFMNHDGIVNAIDTPGVSSTDSSASSNSSSLIASASDDGTARLWDARLSSRDHLISTFEHEFQVTAVAYAYDIHQVFTGGIDNDIYVWDTRYNDNNKSTKPLYVMKGHTDTITSLSLHPKGSTYILSHSMDGTIRSWDIRPYNNKPSRQEKTFLGSTTDAQKGLLNCAWSHDGGMVTGGSSDRYVHIWDEFTGNELYTLPGHAGCVNSVIFHPMENVIASASSDKTIFVGELASTM